VLLLRGADFVTRVSHSTDNSHSGSAKRSLCECVAISAIRYNFTWAISASEFAPLYANQTLDR
jgi:hypothetical protein